MNIKSNILLTRFSAFILLALTLLAIACSFQKREKIPLLDEHLVRLGEIKMAEVQGNKKLTAQYKNNCIHERGFIYIPLLEKTFVNYETNRDNFKNITLFIPTLVDLVKSLNYK